jgi:hypothetical protein
MIKVKNNTRKNLVMHEYFKGIIKGKKKIGLVKDFV